VSQFDVVVVGTGSAGTAAALRCAQAGRRVGIVDERPYGGTCALRGCDPKKVLVGVAELIDWSQRMRGSGIAGDSRIDWPELMRFKRTFTDPAPREREKQLKEAGVTTLHGAARFSDRTTMTIGAETVTFCYAILAAGARPATLGLRGEEHLATSTDFLSLERLPPRVCFVGGGYIAFEFAHIAARASAVPTILQRGPRVLTGFEPSLVDRLVAVSAQIGIDIRVNVRIDGVEATANGMRVFGREDSKTFALECDLAVHAAGRVADLEALDLAAGGVERDAKGVRVNEFFQSSSNPAVCTPPATAPMAVDCRSRRQPRSKANSRRRTFWREIVTPPISRPWRASCTRFRRSDRWD
jgi:glutathione reductase (NADPH)